MVIRAAGVYFSADNIGLNAAATDFGTGLFTTNGVVLGAPNPIPFTPPVGGSWSNPFAAGLVLPQVGITNFVGQNIRVDFADHPFCNIANWNFSIQRQVNSNLLAEIAYVGSKATHLFWNRMDNAVNPLVLDQYGSKVDSVAPNPYFGGVQGGSGPCRALTQNPLLP